MLLILLLILLLLLTSLTPTCIVRLQFLTQEALVSSPLLTCMSKRESEKSREKVKERRERKSENKSERASKKELITWKVLNENELHYSVLKNSCYQLLDSENKIYWITW